MPPIYVDLDFTLSYPIFSDPEETRVKKFVFRPGAREFLEALSPYGELCLLTASEGGWAQDALSHRRDLRNLFSRIITMEDMAGVEQQILSIFKLSGVSESEKFDLLGIIEPIAPPGVVFDDQPYGSKLWVLKSVAVGIYKLGKEFWVRVDRFAKERPDASGLERAFHRFRARNARLQGGRPNSVELAGAPGYNPLDASFLT